MPEGGSLYAPSMARDAPTPRLTPRLTLVTGNPHKLEEARRIVAAAARETRREPPELDSVALDLPEIQSLDLAEVLEAKGEEARRRLEASPEAGPGAAGGDYLVVEETGLEIEAFEGFPGPLVRWMLESVGAEGLARAARGLLREVGKDPTAPRVVARCRILGLRQAGAGEERIPSRIVGEGIEPGTLVLPGRGDGGFGWDPVFLPEGEERTYGELPGEVKDRIGHRGRAWRDLLAKL